MPPDPAARPPAGAFRRDRPTGRLAPVEIAVLAGVPAYWWGALSGEGWDASPAEIVVGGGLGGAWWLLIAGRLAAGLVRRWRAAQPEGGEMRDEPSDAAPVDV